MDIVLFWQTSCESLAPIRMKYVWKAYAVVEVNAVKIPIFNSVLHSFSKFHCISRDLLKISVTSTTLVEETQ